MPYSVKGFFEINEDMVQILLMLEVLFTQNSKVEDLFCGASSGSEPSLFFSNYFFSLGFQPIQDDFQHDFARMTDEADSSVVLAELQVALFRECNNQRLSPWGRPFSICFLNFANTENMTNSKFSHVRFFHALILISIITFPHLRRSLYLFQTIDLLSSQSDT